MLEAVDNRPKIYNRDLQEQPFSLVELMQGLPTHQDPDIQRGTCYVEGFRFINQKPSIKVEGTDFVAFRYNVRRTSIGRPIHGSIATKEWCAKVLLDSRKIIIIPRRNPQGGQSGILYAQQDSKFKMGPSAWWGYDGGMTEALSEFHNQGFSLAVAKFPSSLEEVQQRELQWEQNPDQRHNLLEGLFIDTNPPLELVLQIISQKPELLWFYG